MADAVMRGWALKGAEQRLLEIAEEAARIYAEFPELRDRAGAAPGRGRARGSAGGDTKGLRKARTMSAEARQRISDAQKARWARQKAGGAANAPAAAKSRSGRKKR